MAKTWLDVYEYVDLETGEIIPQQIVEKEYIKARYKTIIKYNGKFNIRHTIWKCRKSGKQQSLW